MCSSDLTLSLLTDARYLDSIVAPSELDGIIAFFPDPWSKKKAQIHRRLFDQDYCAQLGEFLAEGGFFWLKTDAKGNFDQIKTFLAKAGFVENPTKHDITSGNYCSSFEMRFNHCKVAHYQGVFIKNSKIN